MRCALARNKMPAQWRASSENYSLVVKMAVFMLSPLALLALVGSQRANLAEPFIEPGRKPVVVVHLCALRLRARFFAFFALRLPCATLMLLPLVRGVRS